MRLRRFGVGPDEAYSELPKFYVELLVAAAEAAERPDRGGHDHAPARAHKHLTKDDMEMGSDAPPPAWLASLPT